jgi:tol-pal system protein YbgF
MRRAKTIGRWAALAAAAALVLGTGVARAALFDDEEARKAILDLRAKVQSNDDATRAKLGELATANDKLLEQVNQLRRSLLDINSQLEAERADNAKLRGVQEQLVRDLTDTQRRQKDALQTLDDRLRKLEPSQVSLDGKDFLAEPDEKRAYDQAMAALRGGEFDKAAAALAGFVARYPSSGYVESARFWLGNALYGKKDYKEAIAAFRALVAASPEHPRAPEALLAVANCQVEMKDNRGARRTLDELMKSYPKSEAAAAGKERLATIKG